MSRILLIVLIVLMTACSSTKEKDETRSAEEFYTSGKKALDIGDYETAIKEFESLEARYPFGNYSQQAQLDIAYAYYRNDDPDEAVAAADRFIKLYPRHKHVDYLYYLRGLARFNQGYGYFEYKFSLDISKRDPRTTREAFQYFSELITRFPDSQYAVDARQRMIALRNQLAVYEMHVADYYMRRGAYVAAAKRAKYVVEELPQTPATADALALMASAYRQLGIDDLADDALRVLERNNEEHPALTGAESRAIR
ncbi:MAG: competence protein ComL [Gammaproteobacteria bacterium]|nr:MAG: competence protein ComL [Gammaproteobacteria bacterium]TND02637.1 MAG: competence protein ComL [Gammaproteobacteria bacterium]